MKYYKKWKAFQDYKNSQGIHPAWDLVGYVVLMLPFVHLWNKNDNPAWLWTGLGIVATLVIAGVGLDVYLGGQLTEDGRWIRK